MKGGQSDGGATATMVSWCLLSDPLTFASRLQGLTLGASPPAPLTFGALKASHRASHEKPAPLEPNQPYEFTIDLWPISHCFKASAPSAPLNRGQRLPDL